MLCLNPENLGTYRGGCTLEKWDSDACGDICMKFPASQSSVHRCLNETDGSGKQLYSCDMTGCGTSGEMFTVGEAQVQLNAQLSSAVNLLADFTKTVEVTAATTTGGCVSTADMSPGAGTEQSNAGVGTQTCQSPGVSTGAAVGIGLGSSLPLLIALAVMSWLLRPERRRPQGKPLVGPNFGLPIDPATMNQEYKPPGPTIPELPQDTQTRSELDASATR